MYIRFKNIVNSYHLNCKTSEMVTLANYIAISESPVVLTSFIRPITDSVICIDIPEYTLRMIYSSIVIVLFLKRR